MIRKLAIGLAAVVTALAAPAFAQKLDDMPRTVVMTAFYPEWHSLVPMIRDAMEHTINGSTFLTGMLEGKPVVLMQSGVSVVNAAMNTQLVLDRFTVKRIVFSGIAGGVDPALSIGDVVVADNWGQYLEGSFARKTKRGWLPPDEGHPASPPNWNFIFPRGTLITSATTKMQRVYRIPVDPDLLALARQVVPTITLERCVPPSDKMRPGSALCLPRMPKVVVGGTGVTAGIYADNAAFRIYLQRAWKARVLDMESAAVMQVAVSNSVPAIVFRSLSDLAGGDQHKNMEYTFEHLASANSAHVVRAFVGGSAGLIGMTLKTVHGAKGMVTAPHWLAAEAGRSVLQDGGNAVEATVAVAACLAVVYPHMTGIGGDGFWVIHEPDGAVHGIHGCGGAAGAAKLGLYAGLDAVPFRGPLAANTVAGTISGWAAALASAGGSLPLERLVRDAIAHAEAGVAVTAGHAAIAAAKGPELRAQPGAYAATFEPEGRPLQEGDVLRQPVLAATLRRLCDEGLQSFYTGALAADVAEDLAALGSPVSAADLAAQVASRPEPLTVRIEGAQLWNSAPPTQGAASLLILALFDRLAAEVADGFDHVHGLVEATKQAFLLRDRHMGDPTYYGFDWQTLLDDAAALDALAARIDPARALPWPQPPQWGDTCWFGAADSAGRVVSAIQSTYFEFGSGLVLPKTGITWQNRGSSFRLAEGGWNALKPHRKPFHTLNPALARFDDGRVMAYGTMGGEGQPQTQAALFTRYAGFGCDLQAAISAPRWLLGRTWGDQSTTLKLEDGFAPELYAALEAAGHAVERAGPLTATMGHAGAIVRHGDGRLEGATDPRSDGGVAAW